MTAEIDVVDDCKLVAGDGVTCFCGARLSGRLCHHISGYDEDGDDFVFHECLPEDEPEGCAARHIREANDEPHPSPIEAGEK